MTRRLLAGVAALLMLAAGLVGLPAFLMAAYQALDAQMPTLADLPAALLAPGDGGLFLLLIFGIGWVCWAVFAAAFVAEVVARVRGVRPPQLGGFFPQVTVARAVAAVALMVTFAPTASYAAPPATAEASTPTATASVATRVDAASAERVQPAATKATNEQHQDTHDYVVKRGDTLWDIADVQLNDPTRYPEIFEASEDLPQPHGRHLADPDLILPGWTLQVPSPTDPAEAATPPPESDSSPDPAGAHDQASDEPSSPVVPPTTPMQSGDPSAAKSAAPAPGEDAHVALPQTPMQAGAPTTPPAASDPQQLALPKTPMTTHPAGDGSATTAAALARDDDAGARAAVYDDEGRAQPAHGVLGLPNWVTAPLTPVEPEAAPELVAAAHEHLAAPSSRGE